MYFSQAKPSQMAERIDKIQHPLAINYSLCHAHQCLNDVCKLISNPDVRDISNFRNAVGAKLTTGVLLVQASLDALTIMDAMRNGHSPDNQTSFSSNTYQLSSQRLRDIQQQHHNRISPTVPRHLEGDAVTIWKEQNAYTDFWRPANFWKHYYPHQPFIRMFPDGLYDIQINLGHNDTGPVLRDIIIPAYNDAVLLLEIMEPSIATSRAPLL